MSNKTQSDLERAEQAIAAEDVIDSIHSFMHLYRHTQYQSTEENGLSHLDGKAMRFFANHPG